MGLALLLMYPTILIGRTAAATGQQAFFATLMLVATALLIPLDLLLVPWAAHRFSNGAIGGGLSYIMTECFILSVSIRRVAPYILDRTMLVRLFKIAAAGAAMVACTFPIRNSFLLVTVAIGAVVYCGAIVVLRTLTDEEQQMVRRATRRVTSRLSTPSAHAA
jgi:hypothetical protein